MTDKTYYVYLHRRNDNGDPFYVGKGKDKRAWVTRGKNYIWKRIEKISGYTVDVIFRTTVEDCAFSIEVATIKRLKQLGYELANLTDGGEGCSGHKFSDAQRKITQERNWGVRQRKVFDSLGVEYQSVSLAALAMKELGYKSAGSSAISSAANGKRKSIYDRAWAFDAVPKHPEATGVTAKARAASNAQSIPIYSSLEGKFSSLTDACLFLRDNGYPDAKAGCLSRCAKGKSRSSYGRNWSYTHQPEHPKFNGSVAVYIENVGIHSSKYGYFDSPIEAARHLRNFGYPSANPCHIGSCAKGVRKTAYGSSWSYMKKAPEGA